MFLLLCKRDSGKPCTGFGQCVDNAECSSEVNATCKCKAGFYDAWGKCYNEIGAEKPCTGTVFVIGFNGGGNSLMGLSNIKLE